MCEKTYSCKRMTVLGWAVVVVGRGCDRVARVGTREKQTETMV